MMDLLSSAFLIASLSPLAHAGVIGLREAPKDNGSLRSCPAVDGDFPVFHPHPTNCSLFYQCWQGYPFLYSCPAGLYWDQRLSTCNWPSQVECHVNETLNLDGMTGLREAPRDNSSLPSCPAMDGDFPVFHSHPTNCSLFYECEQGYPFLYSCPAGLYWDQRLSTCNWPSHVECHVNETLNLDAVTGLREAPRDDISLPSCPAVDGDFPVFHPHPTNCSLFYQCWQGYPFLYSCPAGLYWDQRLSTCNWPSQVECHANETLILDGVTGLREASRDSSSIPSCPAVDGDFPVFHPHPTNCSLFYQCWQGYPFLYSCPAGLYWDQRLSTCNWPSQVECHTNETLILDGVTGLREAPRDNSSLPSCPAVDGDFPVFHPHRTNCSLFYECEQGYPFLYSCPAGLYWDQRLSTCNWPSQVECHANETLILDGVTELREAPRDNSSLPSCPAVDGDFSVFHPHPTNCSLFYECEQGDPFLYSCPAGLYWDQRLSTCNWPNQVECYSDETIEEPVTEHTAKQDEIEKQMMNKYLFPSCPSSNDPVFFPHPSNCSLFYECSNGIPYLFSCPVGLFFDTEKNICNYPSQVDCSTSDETTPKSSEEPSKPTEEPLNPTEEPSNPTVEPSKQTQEPTEAVEEEGSGLLL